MNIKSIIGKTPRLLIYMPWKGLSMVPAAWLIATLLPGRGKRAARSRAILIFSALVGAMSLARAVSDETLSREILETVGEL